MPEKVGNGEEHSHGSVPHGTIVGSSKGPPASGSATDHGLSFCAVTFYQGGLDQPLGRSNPPADPWNQVDLGSS